MYTDEPPLYFAGLDNEVNITNLEHIGYDYFEIPIFVTDQKPLDMERPSPTSIEIDTIADQYDRGLMETEFRPQTSKISQFLTKLFRRKKDANDNLR